MDKNVANMDHCKILVLDEADKLLSQDFKGMLDHVISKYVRGTFQLQRNFDGLSLSIVDFISFHIDCHTNVRFCCIRLPFH